MSFRVLVYIYIEIIVILIAVEIFTNVDFNILNWDSKVALRSIFYLVTFFMIFMKKILREGRLKI